ncbi:MAG TPA: NAD(P)/FAD-dependent oxidoreductase [Ilumatobacteraceae bacterium]|nr:NAD(P)/FAD-dependent oxidoreductase [Ilumatobacteraceae bacterium]
MSENFDVVVIGAGASGENVAGRVAAGGLTAAVVEAELVGGECSYWACMPSKGLLRPGEMIAAAQRVPGAAEAVTGTIDAAAALARRDKLTHDWDDSSQVRWLDGAGVTLVRGQARITGERVIDVTAADGSIRTLEVNKAVVVATGSASAIPPIPGLRDIRVWDSRAATSAKEVPQRLVVLGGGVVGVEMAQAWKRLGATEVTIIEAGKRLVANLEPFAGEQLGAALADEGIRIVTDLKAVGFERDGGDGPVRVTLDDGQVVEGDELLVAVGRRPSTDDLGLDTIGLEPGRYITVDDSLRATGVSGGWLYAVGDVNGRVLLTHQGKYQARICSDVILGKEITAWADHVAVPSVVFTDPQIGSVGLTEAKARDKGINVRILRYETGDIAAAATRGTHTIGTSQLVVDDDRRVVVGATFVGPEIGELVHAATIAIVGEVTLDRLWHAVPAYPTMSELWLRFLEAAGL